MNTTPDNNGLPEPVAPQRFSAWRRMHQALMPDYNRKATAYWWLLVASGGAILLLALQSVLALPAAQLSMAVVGVVLALLAGYFPIKIPRWNRDFAVSEVFIFLLLLLLGPAAATLAAAGETLLRSWRSSKRWTSRLAGPAMCSIAMFSVGSALTHGLEALRRRGFDDAGLVLLATVFSAVVYFIFNATLTAAALHLKRSSWPQASALIGHAGNFGNFGSFGGFGSFGNCGWMSGTYAVNALVAALLFLSSRRSGIGVLLAAAPIMALLVLTLYYHFRQRALDEAARLHRLDTAEREAQLGAAHVLALQASEQRFQSAFSHASIGMALVGLDDCILQANAALRDLLGLTSEQLLIGQPTRDFIDTHDAAALMARMNGLKEGAARSFAGEFRLRQNTGNEIWARLDGSLFTSIDSDMPCVILQVQDITARRAAEAGLQQIAYHDSLTGLPNRYHFQQLLTTALDQARDDRGKPFGLLFLDFDRFKLINDSLGHAVGDEFLVAVARRIQRQLRNGDAVARLGGDEFAILAVDLDCERYATALAQRLLEALREPFSIANTDITSSVSIGITFSGTGYTSTSDMLRDADTAMYKAKTAGKARYALFDHALHTEVSQRLRLEGELRRALAAGQIAVEYQPIFDLRTARVTGFEALARWEHTELGLVEPSTFIPVAEEMGLMIGLTDFVLRTACRQLHTWQQRGGRFKQLQLHVNLSGIDVAHPNLVGRINKALIDARLRPQDLTLELTENTLMQRLEGALPALTALRESGVGLSVDDFGTGYSSLRHLSKLPVNGLKLAPGFVADLDRSANGMAIVHSIVLMARSLGKSIIAEGIESAEQLARLQEAGCIAGQGYFLARPLAVGVVDQFLDGLASTSMPPTRNAPLDTEHALLH